LGKAGYPSEIKFRGGNTDWENFRFFSRSQLKCVSHFIGISNLTLMHKIYIAMAIRISKEKCADVVALKKIYPPPAHEQPCD
jgi:hypothetical protein